MRRLLMVMVFGFVFCVVASAATCALTILQVVNVKGFQDAKVQVVSSETSNSGHSEFGLYLTTNDGKYVEIWFVSDE